MESVRSPSIADAQSLMHYKRFVPSHRQFRGSLQGKVRFESPVRSHPVQNILTLGIGSVLGGSLDSDRRCVGDWGHDGWLKVGWLTADLGLL